MNREEFIQQLSKLSREELLKRAQEMRERGRKPPFLTEEIEEMFHSLDDKTLVEEVEQETDFGRTKLYLVRPLAAEGQILPVIVNVHGGGWSMPHSDRDLYFCRRMAKKLGVLVVDVDYVLAPEYPYPAALEEIEALLNKLPELLPAWGGDSNKVILCGQSAGGNLLAAVSERRKLSGKLGILAQILCYMPSENVKDHYHGGELDGRAQHAEHYGFFYNPVFTDRGNFDVSVTNSSPEQLQGLLPTEIITGGRDELREDTAIYNQMLRANGVAGSYRCFEESRHGFLVNCYDQYQEGEDYVFDLMRKYLGISES